MDADTVLRVVLREMQAYGAAWRADWSDFDDRTLRGQLSAIANWADEALNGRTDKDYTKGTDFLEDVNGR